MAAVTTTVSINPNKGWDYLGSAVDISTNIDAGNTVTLSPHAKGISVEQNGNVEYTPTDNTSTITQFLQAGIIHRVSIASVEGANGNGAGCGVKVWGD